MGFKMNLLFVLVISTVYLHVLGDTSNPVRYEEMLEFRLRGIRPSDCDLMYDEGDLCPTYSTFSFQSYSKRYWYNKTEKICKPFQYSGCKGNGNNFVEFPNCMYICNKDNSTQLV